MIADNINFDLDAFRGQRALLQGASGSGKSNGARLLLEASFDRFQHLVIDVEDEFHTLRTADRGYAIIGGDSGDAPLTIKQDAGELALTLLKVGVSTVLQIGDWTLEEKRVFIGQFVAGMMRAKSDLWHPTIVMLDEAHLWIPQQGVVASSEAVTHLATAGRKRGFSAIFATQRLSLINKDVLGQCENKFLGRIEQSADRRAVADLLGFQPRSAEAVDMQGFRPGEFYVVGPALAPVPTRTRLYRAETQAPKPGSTVAPSAAPEAIRAALAELTKASKAAEVAEKVAADAAKGPPNAAPAPDYAAAEKRGYDRGNADGRGAGRIEGYADGYRAALKDAGQRVLDFAGDFTLFVGTGEFTVPPLDAGIDWGAGMKPEIKSTADFREQHMLQPIVDPIELAGASKWNDRDGTLLPRTFVHHVDGPPLTNALQRALDAVMWWHRAGFAEIPRARAAIVAGLSPTASTFGVYTSKLIALSLVEVGEVQGTIRLTPKGRALASPAPDADNRLIDKAADLLSPQPRKLLYLVGAHWPGRVTRDALADLMELSRTASTLGVYISSCSKLGFVDTSDRGFVKAADWLMEKTS